MKGEISHRLKNRLLAAAAAAALKSYAPYSKLKVGATLLVKGGRVMVGGCNVENASFGLTICAERAALSTAVSAGFRRFQALAVVVRGKASAVPCGACLQVLSEFCSPDMPVFTAAAGRRDRIKMYRLGDLLPNVFKF
jgi:cytidine deaminase